jgi:6-pyruvoyltetrahydropterin/6-carboxytetrahydropterin synthase
VIQVTRRYRIASAHVLSNPTLLDAENDAIFGKCANPNGHGHNYGFEVTVTGPVDETSGQIIAPEALDAIFEDTIASRYAYHLLNDCKAFDALVPTTENFARVVYEDLAPEVARRGGARLVRVRVIETPRNTFEYGDPQ